MDKNLTLKQIEKIVKKKKGVNPKTKGKRGESWFAEKLTKITGLHFHRIYTSGASVGKNNADMLEELTQAQGESMLGDIYSPESFTHYFVWESKNYGELDFHNLINTKSKFSKRINGWIDELEYDIESAITKMKNGFRPVAGFLCVKITRKGSWIIGNKKYVENTFFTKHKMIIDNHLLFYYEPRESLKKIGFGTEYFMTDFESFIKANKKNLFIVDTNREKRLKKAREAFRKIYHG